MSFKRPREDGGFDELATPVISRALGTSDAAVRRRSNPHLIDELSWEITATDTASAVRPRQRATLPPDSTLQASASLAAARAGVAASSAHKPCTAIARTPKATSSSHNGGSGGSAPGSGGLAATLSASLSAAMATASVVSSVVSPAARPPVPGGLVARLAQQRRLQASAAALLEHTVPPFSRATAGTVKEISATVADSALDPRRSAARLTAVLCERQRGAPPLRRPLTCVSVAAPPAQPQADCGAILFTPPSLIPSCSGAACSASRAITAENTATVPRQQPWAPLMLDLGGPPLVALDVETNDGAAPLALLMPLACVLAAGVGCGATVAAAPAGVALLEEASRRLCEQSSSSASQAPPLQGPPTRAASLCLYWAEAGNTASLQDAAFMLGSRRVLVCDPKGPLLDIDLSAITGAST